MKCIVETTGSFMLLNSTLEEIPSERPSVTTMGSFVDIRINKKELKVFARNLPRKASDEDFKKVLDIMDGKVKPAVEAYCAELGVTIDGEARDDIEEDVEAEAIAAEEAKEAEEKVAAEAEAEAEELADKVAKDAEELAAKVEPKPKPKPKAKAKATKK